MKKKRAREKTGMGYYPFSSFGHDTTGCIATGRAQARSRARHGLACVLGRVAVRYDMA